MSAPTRLFNRNFVLLYQGQLVSAMGTQAFSIAMMFWLKHTTGSASLMGTIMMLSMFPMVLLSPFGGTLADRVSRRGIIIACDVVSGVSVLSLAIMMYALPAHTALLIGWLAAVSVISGVVNGFFHPAIKASIPSIVPADKVAAANSLDEGSVQVSTLVGQGIGGVLFRIAGAPLLFLIDGITFIFSAFSESFAQIPQQLPEKAKSWREDVAAFRKDFNEGMSYVWHNKGMRNFMLVAAIANFFAMPFAVLLPFYVEDYLGATTDWYGFLLAALGGGGVIGYVIAGSIRLAARARVTALIGAVVVLSASMGSLGLATRPVEALLLMLLAGVCNGYFHVIMITTFQLGTPESLRGRIFGVLHTLVLGLAPVSMGLAGIVADRLNHNTPPIFLACGMVLVLVSISLAVSRPTRDFIANLSPLSPEPHPDQPDAPL